MARSQRLRLGGGEMRKIDLTGKKFGRLVVVAECGHDKRSQILWSCVCECGNSTIVTGGHLRGKHTTSCGCLRREKVSKRCTKVLTGKRFGKLTVIKENGRSNNGKILWECVCDCGNIVTVIGGNLKRKATTSCGCVHRELVSILGKGRRIWDSPIPRRKLPIKPSTKIFHRIPECDNPTVENGMVLVSCKLCGKLFAPSYNQVQSRVSAWEGRECGEHNFYCSDGCRTACPVFNAHTHQPDPRLRKPKSVTAKARACQSKTLKQIQCDESHGQSYCERCGDMIDVELHHTLPVAEYGEDAINPAGHILLCAGCHVALHRECA